MTPAAPVAAPTAAAVDDDSAESGFMALELGLCFTLIVVLTLTIVAFGRVDRARSLADQAASDAARAAAEAFTPAGAQQAASAAATSTLSSAGISCSPMVLSLDTSQFRPGGEVVARLKCTASLADLSVTGAPGSIQLQGQSAAPVDTFRKASP